MHLRFFFSKNKQTNKKKTPTTSTKSQPKFIKLLLNYLLNGPKKKYFWHFWNFENWNSNEFVPVSVTWDPNETENFKTILLQITDKSFKTSPEFSSYWPSQKHIGDIWNCEFRFLTHCLKKCEIHHCSIRKLQLCRKWEIVERNGDTHAVIQLTYMGYLWPCSVKILLGSSGALPSFLKIRFPKHYLFYKLQPKFS